MRAGVHHVGLHKCVIAAPQMLEIDPWLDIEISPAGLTPGGLSEEDANEAVRAFDLDGDGVGTREEYVGPWLDFFATDAPDAPASRILGRL
ncbi:hypothetical protein [Streptomyces sp. NPDC091268]|uniref:hypothetical protein n=1 Tax=Streptomyces sp. NPDC091268 TaxID=3365979 RepID=UPI003827CEEE